MSDGRHRRLTDRVSVRVVSSRLDATATREAVIEAIQDLVTNLIGSEQLAIWTLDEGASTLSLVHSEGIDAGPFQTVPVGAGVIGRVAASGEPYVAPEDGDDSDAPNLTACFPLKVGDAVIGAFALFGLMPQKPGLEAVDHHLLERLGTLGGDALERTAAGGKVA